MQLDRSEMDYQLLTPENFFEKVQQESASQMNQQGQFKNF